MRYGTSQVFMYLLKASLNSSMLPIVQLYVAPNTNYFYSLLMIWYTRQLLLCYSFALWLLRNDSIAQLWVTMIAKCACTLVRVSILAQCSNTPAISRILAKCACTLVRVSILAQCSFTSAMRYFTHQLFLYLSYALYTNQLFQYLSYALYTNQLFQYLSYALYTNQL